MTGGTRALARASERATRLYAAENAASAAFPSRRYQTFAELRAHAEAIVCSDWWADTFPDAPIEVHIERRSSSATFSAASRRNDIGIIWLINGVHWTTAVLCHELAHLASDSGHDAQFQRALLALWRQE